MCVAKLNYIRKEKSNGWVNTDEKVIFESAGLKCTGNERSDYIADLYLAKVIEFAKKNTNLSRRVTFINNESEPVLLISDFRELGYAYLRYCGENIIECGQCGILIRGTANHSRRYCNECNGSKPMISKKVKCVDCGVEFTVNSKNNKTHRCAYCQKEYVRAYDRERKKRDNSV